MQNKTQHGIKKADLGNTGLVVTQLCFGALPMGPMQLNLPEEQGAGVISAALDAGVNFIDTAQSYRTYGPIRRAIRGRRSELVIATKSAATTYEEMEKAIHESLERLETDYIDIFHLHAARASVSVFEDRKGAHQCLLDYKRKGLIRAVGISTHSVKVARIAAERSDIDVLFPLINMAGIGLLEGTVEEMAEAIALNARAGKGVYAMKIFAGGNLLDQREKALHFAFDLKGIHSIAIGMVNRQEVEMNVALFRGLPVARELQERTGKNSKRLVIQSFCKGCGTCVEQCPNGALAVIDGKARVDRDKCLLCGYCSPHCPEFAIRMV
ncbi:MAG: aldo/keto reductase [Syntrophothermus sp.]